MSEYIDKWQAVRNLMDVGLKDPKKAVDAIQFMRADDVRPVITCGECIHRHDPRRQMCTGRKPDFFCADGEKREEYDAEARRIKKQLALNELGYPYDLPNKED